MKPIAPDPQARRVLDRLIEEGMAVRTFDTTRKREVVFPHDAVEEARSRLAPPLAGTGVPVGGTGAAPGNPRTCCLPLPEHLDANRFIRRVADRRMPMPRQGRP